MQPIKWTPTNASPGRLILPVSRLTYTRCKAHAYDEAWRRRSQAVGSCLAAFLAAGALLGGAPPAPAMDLSYAGKEVKAKLEERDAAMEYKCKGG